MHATKPEKQATSFILLLVEGLKNKEYKNADI
jgi:hypothetical protein